MRYYVFFAFLYMDIDFFNRILEVDSTSGNEAEFADMLASEFAAPGRSVELFEVGDGTRNLLVSWGTPKVVFCTHLDTVPPYIPPVVSGEHISGRGACDAKGQLFSMYQACQILESRGYDDFGLLLLAGEETGSHGAKAFAALMAEREQIFDWVIVGEPTDNVMASAAKGTKAFEVTFSGKACHSGYPENGASAVEFFNDFVNALRSIRFPEDEVLGDTTWNIGRLVCDNPQNVLSDNLKCSVYFRTTFESDEMVCNIMKNMSGPDAKLRFGRKKAQDGSDLAAKDVAAWQSAMSVRAFGGDTPGHFDVLPGFESRPVAFGSDAPHLTCFRHKILSGPGSILVAHRPDEFITVPDIEKAVADYVEMAEYILKKSI